MQEEHIRIVIYLISSFLLVCIIVGAYTMSVLMILMIIAQGGRSLLLMFFFFPFYIFGFSLLGALGSLSFWNLFKRDGIVTDIYEAWRKEPLNALLATSIWIAYWIVAIWFVRKYIRF